jgi:hypothetical protein
MAENPHFDFPFRRGPDGKVAVVEQRSPQHITSQQLAVVLTPQGYRAERPDFGWEWPEFATIPLDLSSLRDAFIRLVPDADSTIEEWADAADAAIRNVLVSQILSGEGVAYSSESTSGYGGATSSGGE